MARLSNIRGMLLEEVLLRLLESTGYETVIGHGDDPTLEDGAAGLMVRGRGTSHQIDAIADFRVYQPFSHPQRLLVEAKCLDASKRVGLDIVRRAVGTLKDVSEFWVMDKRNPIPNKRYHYQYAVFSATSYTPPAQRYSFAQDIYLIPLADSVFFETVIRAIRGIDSAASSGRRNPNIPVNMLNLRREVREALRADIPELFFNRYESMIAGLNEFVEACRGISFSLLAVIGGRVPIFLVPAPDLRLESLRTDYAVRIFRGPNDRTWYLRDISSNHDLFSFDLPRELFLRYADQGILSERAALDLKQQELSELQAVFVRDDRPALVRFHLDLGWLEYVRRSIKEQPGEPR